MDHIQMNKDLVNHTLVSKLVLHELYIMDFLLLLKP